MISKNELKFYSSLLIKKYRKQENKFIAEGIKSVLDGLNSSYKIDHVFTTPLFIEQNQEIISAINKKSVKLITVKSNDFQKISDTKSPQGIAAVFDKRYPKRILSELKDRFIVLIDNISDPGNLGTILRTCDWFGIYNILISSNSVEYLNPKVLRSAMGSIFHLNIYDGITEKEILELKSNGYKLITSDLKGKNVFSFSFFDKQILSFSNESIGPSDKIKMLADSSITIPGSGKAESLNVSSAAAIILANCTNYLSK